MSQPPTAAIAVASIVGGVAALFVSYKVYVKLYNRRQQRHSELPPIRDPQDYTSQYLSPASNAMAGTLYGGDQYSRDSFRGSGSHSKASLASHFDRAAYNDSEIGFPEHQRRSSSQGFLLQSSPLAASNTELPFPTSPSVAANDPPASALSRPVSVLDAYEVPHHNKNQSSSSSTMTIKRNYATSIRSSPGLTTTMPVSTYRRDSYLPHLPENRDQIQIVPPQPLGFGLGGMATATDQKTLAFSTSSGIGLGTDDFSRGLVWQEGNPEAASHALQHRASKLGEDERQRYLAQGPRAMSPAMRGALHNHLYAGSNAGSSGMRTPDIPSSRSRSPAPAAPWDGASTSDIGPSVSQRGTVSPSEHPLQQLEPSPLILPTGSNISRHPVVSSQQSPLGMMSQAGPEEQGLSQRPFAHGSPGREGASLSNSPILGAFRNPSTSHQPENRVEQAEVTQAGMTMHAHSDSQNSGSNASGGEQAGERTPGLMSGSVSTEHGSASAPKTDSSGRQSASEHRQAGESMGQDGVVTINMGESESLPNEPADAIQAKTKEKQPGKGWLFGKRKGKA